jgi:hypothetical protein
MAKIIGTPTVTPVPKTDFLQTDPTKADYLKGREHIATKEEWITIADTTLTEDVASLEFTTDINGNPFRCKEILVSVLMPATGVNGTKYYFGLRTDRVYGLVRDAYGFVIKSTANGIFMRHETHDYSGWVHTYNYGCNTTVDYRLFDRYCIAMPINEPFRTKTRIQIWGLKA